VLTIFDRYLVREILLPFFLALVVLTFILLMPPVLENAQQLIEKGVDPATIVRILLTLVPQALSVTIPMALLYGVLMGLGRLSTDREFVALQACGVSIFRALRPIAVLALVAFAADQYVLLALQRLELGKPHRHPLFAEVDLVSSHAPWTRVPRLINWGRVGDGSIFKRLPVDEVGLNDSRQGYAQSIRYTLRALFSFVEHYGGKNLVLVVLGDHQPSRVASDSRNGVPICEACRCSAMWAGSSAGKSRPNTTQ